MPQLTEGDKAPLLNKIFDINNLKGKKHIIYFYPKDNTPGCTAEACNLRDNFEDLTNKNFEIIGISPDSEERHEKFISKHNLPFKLIADTEKEILDAYGAWGEKKLYGRKYMGVIRQTFIVDENGIIEKIIKKVKTKDHTNQIYKELNIN